MSQQVPSTLFGEPTDDALIPAALIAARVLSCVARLDAKHRQGDEGAALQGRGGAARADVPQQPRDLHKAREARPSHATRLHL